MSSSSCKVFNIETNECNYSSYYIDFIGIREYILISNISTVIFYNINSFFIINSMIFLMNYIPAIFVKPMNMFTYIYKFMPAMFLDTYDLSINKRPVFICIMFNYNVYINYNKNLTCLERLIIPLMGFS